MLFFSQHSIQILENKIKLSVEGLTYVFSFYFFNVFSLFKVHFCTLVSIQDLE